MPFREFESAWESKHVFYSVLERMRDPLTVLQKLREVLDIHGYLMLISPMTDSKAAGLVRASWWEFNRANLFYFSVDTLQNLLIRAGFGEPIVIPDRSLVSLNYLRQRLSMNPYALRRFRWLRGIMSLAPVLRNKTSGSLTGEPARWCGLKPDLFSHVLDHCARLQRSGYSRGAHRAIVQ
jgi:hypothetical protein